MYAHIVQGVHADNQTFLPVYAVGLTEEDMEKPQVYRWEFLHYFFPADLQPLLDWYLTYLVGG